MNETTEIWKERNRIERERRAKMTELMDEYDRTVYWPQRKVLVERCLNNGHHWTFRDTNPIGYPIFQCTVCGTTEIRKE